MTKLTFFKNREHFIGFSCEGHSGFACEGYDIVCAAVSTSVQLTANYLIKYFGNLIEFAVDDETAFIEIKCKQKFIECDRQISVLEDFAKDLQTQYPDYFTFDYLEV